MNDDFTKHGNVGLMNGEMRSAGQHPVNSDQRSGFAKSAGACVRQAASQSRP
jgi:hypothetical protein